MPDEMDLCQQHNYELIDDALKARLRYRPTGNSLRSCAICGDSIPEERRKASPGCTKCVSCQEEWEQMHGSYRRGM